MSDGDEVQGMNLEEKAGERVLAGVTGGEHDASSIEAVRRLVERARKPYFVNIPNRRERGMVTAEGGFERGFHPPRRYEAENLLAFNELVNYVAGSYGDGARHAVFVDQEGALAVFDEGGQREDTVSVTWDEAGSFDVLERAALRDCRDYSQADLIDLIKRFFGDSDPHGMLHAPQSLLAYLETIKIQSSEGGRATVQHGNETVDLQVEQQIGSDRGDIPEEVTLYTPVFDIVADGVKANWDTDPEFKVWPVTCRLSINVKVKGFKLSPLEGQVGRALQNAVDYIYLTLACMEWPESVSILPGACANVNRS